jgi:hypothetical protein
MATGNTIQEATLTPDDNLSPTPPRYTPVHRPHIKRFPTPMGFDLSLNLGKPRSENLHN